MCRLQLIETLRMDDGAIRRLPYHERRYEQTMQHFWPGKRHDSLLDILGKKGLSEHNSPLRYPGIFKVHIDYGDGATAIIANPYRPKHVNSLRLVTDNSIDYSYKYADRSRLAKCLDKRGDCDEVIIVKNNLLTDTSYSNIALFNGTTWLTPRAPLLRGTMRACLLDCGLIKEADIHPSDLSLFTRVSLINAMLPLDALSVAIDDIC